LHIIVPALAEAGIASRYVAMSVASKSVASAEAFPLA
jgi:hypothetical protein